MIILTGTYPPEKCGVGDYVQHLLSCPSARDWSLLYLKSWRLTDLRSHIAQLRQREDQIVNLQYPTVGYGTSLVPHLLMIYAVLFLRKKLFITVHEYSQLGWKGKLALQFLFLFATNVIFTTSFELTLARKQGLSARKGVVIKIHSNIPLAAHIQPVLERKWDVGYFGYIRPLKGLEEFLVVAEQLQKAGKKVYILGQTQPEYKDFYEPFLNEMKQKGIVYISDKTKEEVANILADTKMMYLPFPDGLSERRGSFLAAVTNEAIIVSRQGDFTSEQQKQSFLFVDTSSASQNIQAWLQDPDLLASMQQKSRDYCQQEVPASWEDIAKEYKNLLSR